jgi:hypothetical protein
MTRPANPHIWARYLGPLFCASASVVACAGVPSWTASDAVVMLVPPEVPNPTLDRGCWIRLSDGPDFSGQSFVLVGPAEMRAFDQATIARFRRRVSSAETGPRAMAKLYSRENFTGTALTMGPSEKKAQVGRAFGASQLRVQALRLSCKK